jgi:hypothetical protein
LFVTPITFEGLIDIELFKGICVLRDHYTSMKGGERRQKEKI